MFVDIVLQILRINSWMLKLFSDDVVEVRKEVTAPVAADDDDEVVDPRPSDPQNKVSPEFTKELEMTVHRGRVLCRMLPWSRLTKIVLKARTLLPRLLPLMKVLVRPIRENC
jgi:hypothetical protein